MMIVTAVMGVAALVLWLGQKFQRKNFESAAPEAALFSASSGDLDLLRRCLLALDTTPERMLTSISFFPFFFISLFFHLIFLIDFVLFNSFSFFNFQFKISLATTCCIWRAHEPMWNK